MLPGMVRLVLLLLFVGLPLVELYLLVRVAAWLGPAETIALVLVTGVVGGSLAHHQGLSTLRRIQTQLAAGETPGGQLGHGALILVAGLLLITPGIITDCVGTLLLVPPIRAALGRWLFGFLARRFKGGITFVHHTGTGPWPEEPPPPSKHVDVKVIDGQQHDDG